MLKSKNILIRFSLLTAIALTVSSCGLFWGRGWGGGCRGPYYYEDRRTAEQYNQPNYNR